MREIEELIACFYHFLFQHLIFVNENTDFASTLKARCFTLLTKLESSYALFATFSCVPSCSKDCDQNVFLLPSWIYDVRSKPLDFNWFGVLEWQYWSGIGWSLRWLATRGFDSRRGHVLFFLISFRPTLFEVKASGRQSHALPLASVTISARSLTSSPHSLSWHTT